MSHSRFAIVGLGEALFDLLPEGQVLGGAPLNVAIHAHQLGQVRGGEGIVVSRVGQDPLGQQIFDELRHRGMDTTYLQTDPDRPTGEVYVEFDDEGRPRYDIVENVAWDVLRFDPDLESLAGRADAVCFGSLAQRNGEARGTIYRVLEAARRAIRLFDVNLRQSYFTPQILQRSCEYATAVKLNHEELPVVASAMGIHLTAEEKNSPDRDDRLAAALRKRFDLRQVVLTRGEAGTVIYTAKGRHEGEPVRYEPAEGADPVGAGDACAAGVLVGLVLRLPMDRVVHLANHAGAYVAAQKGATPSLPESVLNLLRTGG